MTQANPVFRLRLDLAEGTLDCEGKRLRLRPKTMAVLAALAERPGAVLRQDDLRRLVWGRQFGNDAGPKQCIRELRKLLGDACIETVGRAGYRLRAAIDIIGDPASGRPGGPVPLCVGRAEELACLQECGTALSRGERAMVLISGEAGAGKTRLTDAFLSTQPESASRWIARGQCVPHAQAREAYGPLIEILSALLSGCFAAQLCGLINDTAPSWRAQLAAFDDPGNPTQSLPDMPNGPADRMLREFGDLLERFTRRLPGILVLEDLHWADPGTLAWLAAWSLRRTNARLLIIGTYRLDVAGDSDDLGITLRLLVRQNRVRMLRLGSLDRAAVADLVAQHFPGHAFPAELSLALTERTEGHASLVDAVLDQWRRRDIRLMDGRWTLLRSADQLIAEIAPNLRGLIIARIEELTPAERRLLEAASVAGIWFSAAALARDGGVLERVERALETLARRRCFIEPAGSWKWPDGRVSESYCFCHALYRETLYDLIPAANRAALHRRIGDRLEAGYGERAGDIAPVLADHFERGGDPCKAALHRGRLGVGAPDRGAARDAILQFRYVPARPAQCIDEPDSPQGRGAALITSEGLTAPELPGCTIAVRSAAARRHTDQSASDMQA